MLRGRPDVIGGDRALSTNPISAQSVAASHTITPSRLLGTAKADKVEGRALRLLSLYGGVGHLAESFARRGGLSIVFDLDRHPENDLSKRKICGDIDGLVSVCDILGVDLPCCTWSRARRAPPTSPFPSAVRSNQFLMGLPDLNHRDQALIRRHNFMYRQAIKWIRAHIARGGSGYLENPLTSMLWKTRGVQRLLKITGVRLVDFNMCQYNTSWRKGTRMLVWGPWADHFPALKCTGTSGLCSRTHRPHVTLSGGR